MKTAESVRPIDLAEIREAQRRIAGTIFRTPLVRLELGPGFPDIRLKLEVLQPINAYKLRGAANAVAMLSDSERKRGVWTSAPAMRDRESPTPREQPVSPAPSSRLKPLPPQSSNG
jgi:Threonine dehydratase